MPKIVYFLIKPSKMVKHQSFIEFLSEVCQKTCENAHFWCRKTLLALQMMNKKNFHSVNFASRVTKFKLVLTYQDGHIKFKFGDSSGKID